MPEVTPLVVVPDNLLAENGDFLVTEAGDNFITESTFTNALTATTAEAPTTSESAAAARTPRSITGTATDALATAEAATATKGAVSLSRTATDALTTAESAAAIRTPLSVTRTATDALATAEAVTRIGNFKRIGSDTITTAESVAATKFAFIVRSTADALTTSDAANRVGSFHPATIDAISTGEATAKAVSHPRSTTDTLTTAEAVTGVRIGGGAFNRTTAEALSTAEAIIRGKSTARTATDAVATADVVARIGSFHPAATDNPTTAEVVVGTKFAFIARTATDALNASDSDFPLVNLVSYWKLDEASGTRFDSVGSNHLTANGSFPANVTGIQGSAPVFAAFTNNNYLSCTSNSSLQMPPFTDFTISCWVKLTSLPVTSAAYSLVTKDDDAFNSRDYTLDYFNAAGQGLRFYVAGGAGGLIGGIAATIGNWFHLVAWFDSTTGGGGSLHIRVNDTSQVDSSPSGGLTPNVSAAQFRIGAREYAGFEDFADATIDEVGLWKRILTPAEITYLYNGGAGRTIGFGPIAVVKPAIVRTATDALATSEASTKGVVTSRSATDGVTTADAVTRSIVGAGGTAYTRTATDSLSAVMDFPGLNDGDSVTLWPGKAAGNSGGSPSGTVTFKTNQVNGLPAVFFNGGYLTLTTPIPAASGEPWTIIAVMKAVSGQEGFGLGHAGGGGVGSDSYGGPRVWVSSGQAFVHAAGGVFGATSGSVWNAWHIITVTTAPRIFLDGVDVGTLSYYAAPVPYDLTIIGGGSYGGTPDYEYIGALLVFNTVLSSTDIANIEKTLANKYALSVAGGAPIDISSISGLVGWWEGDSLTGSSGAVAVVKAAIVRTATDALSALETIPGLSDNDPVTTWPDSSPNHFDATGSGTTRPVFKAGITPSGKPVVRFDGSDDYLATANAATAGITNAITICLVLRTNVIQASVPLFAYNLSPDSRIGLHIPYVDGYVYFDLGDYNTGRISAPWGGNTTDFFVWTFVANGTEMWIYRNGVQLAYIYWAVNNFTANGLVPFTLGNIAGGGLPANQDAAEMVVYNTAAALTDRANLEKGLADKWGLTVAGGTAVDPSTLSGMRVWWKADALLGSPGAVAVVTPAIGKNRTATDALSTSEAASKSATHPRPATDSLTLADSVTRSIVVGGVAVSRTATDALTISEAPNRSVVTSRAATDVPHTAEAVTGTKVSALARSATEALSTADSVTKIAAHPRTATDAPTTADVTSKAATHPRTAADALTTAEVASRTTIQTRTTTDALVIAETVTAIRTGAGVFARSTAETLTVSMVSAWKLTALRAVVDALATAEVVSRGVPRSRTTTETLSTADAATAVRSPRSITRTTTEVLSTTELAAASKFGLVTRTATESLTANLVGNRVLVAGRATGEALTVAMAANRRWVGSRIATDMLIAVDSAIAEGTAFLFIAGQVAGSTPYVTSAGSKLRISSTNSDLDITVAGSNVKAPRTGSGLKVEKTNGYHT